MTETSLSTLILAKVISMSAMPHGLSRLDQLFKVCLKGQGPASEPFGQTFGRLFPKNPVETQNLSDQQVIDALDHLAQTMNATTIEDGPAEAGMTFLGQFVDHDITLDATSALGSRIDPATILNVRTPALDLDCVYGAGPEATPHLYGRDNSENYLLFGRDDNPVDLARTCNGRALIGDPRNDENIIVSQIQGAFIALHNILMDRMGDADDAAHDIHNCAHMGMDASVWQDYVPEKLRSFEQVRRFVRLHYQHVIWTELLPAFVDQACLDAALADHDQGGPVMPVEFSGAAYRFGHATTQPTYRLTSAGDPKALFDILGFDARGPDATLEFDQFFKIHGSHPQHARPVGTTLGDPLFHLPFVHTPMQLDDLGLELTLPQSQNLPLRNMMRDRYTYQLASGQQAANHLHVTQKPHVPQVLKDKGITKTPLWFYCLQEAEEFGHGKLTGVGGAIVASVFARLLKQDKTSVLHVHGFEPWSGFTGHGSTFGGMLKFVEAHRDSVSVASDLRCG